MPHPTRIDASTQPEDRWEDPARGSLRWKTLISAGLTPTDSLVCGVAIMAPGDHFALHSHPEAELYFGLSGRGTVMIDGKAHEMAPGVALYIPGGAVHGVPQADEPLEWFYVFARDSFDQIAYSFVPPHDPQPE